MAVQLAGLIYPTPITTTKITTPTLINTNIVLDMALSRMPITKTAVTAKRINTAGRFMMAFGVENGSLLRNSGTCQLKIINMNSLKYSVQAEATVAPLMAYSRTRSQPMIQA